IFYDLGPEFADDVNDPKLYLDGEIIRYVEIWNLVFSEFIHNPDDTYMKLVNKNINTCIGFERMVSINQIISTNFDTDLFTSILEKIISLSSIKHEENS